MPSDYLKEGLKFLLREVHRGFALWNKFNTAGLWKHFPAVFVRLMSGPLRHPSSPKIPPNQLFNVFRRSVKGGEWAPVRKVPAGFRKKNQRIHLPLHLYVPGPTVSRHGSFCSSPKGGHVPPAQEVASGLASIWPRWRKNCPSISRPKSLERECSSP